MDGEGAVDDAGPVEVGDGADTVVAAQRAAVAASATRRAVARPARGEVLVTRDRRGADPGEAGRLTLPPGARNAVVVGATAEGRYTRPACRRGGVLCPPE